MRSKDEIRYAVAAHADDVYRACAVYLREKADREDAFQETFLRLAKSNVTFTDDEHAKAWLICVATNVCKDMLKCARMKDESLEDGEEHGFVPVGDDGQEGQRTLEGEELVAALRKIDERYRMVLVLKYYKGYTAAQISRATGMPENTVYTNISRGKKQLLEVLGHGRV